MVNKLYGWSLSQDGGGLGIGNRTAMTAVYEVGRNKTARGGIHGIRKISLEET
jgi:hypothetical protein